MGGSHQVVVHRVGKVIGGNAVGFQQHHIDHILLHFNFAFDQIVKAHLALRLAGGAQAQGPGLAGVYIGLDLVVGQIPTVGVGSPVAFNVLVLLSGVQVFQLLRGTKAGVSQPFLHQKFAVALVNVFAQTLGVRAVGAAFTSVAHHAFVRCNAVDLQRREHGFHRALYLALLIRIFHPHIEYAVGAAGGAVCRRTGKQIAKVQKACWAGRKAADSGALFQLPGRVLGLVIRRGHGNMGKEQRCDFFIFRHDFTYCSGQRAIAPFCAGYKITAYYDI